MKALIISADNFEDSELLVPYYRLKEARVEVDVASMKIGTIKGKHGYEVAVDKTFDAVDPEEYALLVLPGGKAPEKVRKEKNAIPFLTDVHTTHHSRGATHAPHCRRSSQLARWAACRSSWFRPNQGDRDGYCHEGCRQLDKECNLDRCGKRWRRDSTTDRMWFSR